MVNPDFEAKQIEKASKACTAICLWVRAMHKYNMVAKQVEPKRKLLAEKQVCGRIYEASYDRVLYLVALFGGRKKNKSEGRRLLTPKSSRKKKNYFCLTV